ncbi:MAG: hypothetical protein ACFFA1_05000 [Promethearchaeota archaeon]
MSGKRHTIELEIFEGKCSRHEAGQKFKYPKDRGKICQWLLDSAIAMIRVLEYGGRLPWKYAGTPYEKQVDPESVSTEFVRCPDPTSEGIVLKITSTYEKAPNTSDE